MTQAVAAACECGMPGGVSWTLAAQRGGGPGLGEGHAVPRHLLDGEAFALTPAALGEHGRHVGPRTVDAFDAFTWEPGR
jgi:hypothetical protein